MEPLSEEESEIRAKKSVCMSKHFGEQNVFAAFDRHLIIAHQFDAFKNTTTEKKRDFVTKTISIKMRRTMMPLAVHLWWKRVINLVLFGNLLFQMPFI